MEQYCFRPLEESELPAVLEIYNYYILNTTATFHENPLSIHEMQNLVFFNNPKYQTFTIYSNGALGGYILLTRFKQREAYSGTAEVTIYLKPELTGKGIGSPALNFIEQFARQKQFHVLIAVICGENLASIRLFAKNGYSQCAHYREVGRKFDRLLDVVAYQKVLK